MAPKGARVDHCGADGWVLSGSSVTRHHQPVPRARPIFLLFQALPLAQASTRAGAAEHESVLGSATFLFQAASGLGGEPTVSQAVADGGPPGIAIVEQQDPGPSARPPGSGAEPNRTTASLKRCHSCYRSAHWGSQAGHAWLLPQPRLSGSQRSALTASRLRWCAANRDARSSLRCSPWRPLIWIGP